MRIDELVVRGADNLSAPAAGALLRPLQGQNICRKPASGPRLLTPYIIPMRPPSEDTDTVRQKNRLRVRVTPLQPHYIRRPDTSSVSGIAVNSVRGRDTMGKRRNSQTYALYDGRKKVYIGETNDPERRLDEHLDDGNGLHAWRSRHVN